MRIPLRKAFKKFQAEERTIPLQFHYYNVEVLPSEIIRVIFLIKQHVVIKICIPWMVPNLFVNQILSILKSFPHQA